MNKKVLQLPIYMAKEHVSDFCVTLPLCVALTDKKMMPWYYENLVNICSICWNKMLVFSKYGPQFMGFYNEVFKYCVLPISETNVCNVGDIIISQLEKEKNYCYIVLDEYYVSCKKSFNSYHFVHQSLIYGYDYNRKVFLVIAFNKNDHLDFLEYSYDEVNTAFYKNKEIPSVIFFRLRENRQPYSFSPQRFIKQLENYINSVTDCVEHFTATNISGTFRDSYGISAIRHTLDMFSPDEGIDYTDFKNIHFLYEHKMLLYKTFCYIRNEGYFDNTCDGVLKHYSEIVSSYFALRNLALKALYIPKLSRRFDIQRRIKLKINELINEEVTCLIEILKCIKIMVPRSSIDRLIPEKVVIEDGNKTLEYMFNKTFTFSWTETKNILSVSIPKHHLINIIIDDGERFQLFSRFECPEKNYEFKLNCSCNKIVVEMYSNYEISNNNLPLFYQNDLTHNKRIVASSFYDENNEVNLYGHRYWRAAEQKNGYDGSDWIEVDFEKNTSINAIVIGELDYSPRLKKYRILYFDVESNWNELLTHDFVVGEEQVHRFEKIEAIKLRVEFLECVKEQNGYYEPIVNTFKAYFAE